MWIRLPGPISPFLRTGFLLRMICLVSLISTADERRSRRGCGKEQSRRELCDQHRSPRSPSEPPLSLAAAAASTHPRPTRVGAGRVTAHRSRYEPERTEEDYFTDLSNVVPHLNSPSIPGAESHEQGNELEGTALLPDGKETGGAACDRGIDETQRRRRRERRRSRLPSAIVIGVKKGGTRALLEFLKVNPDIRAPGPETHFFDRKYDRGLEWYRSLMPETAEGQVTVEKTPSYFVTSSVPTRVRNMSSSVKLIVVVRDPVTRAISDYTQAATKRRPREHRSFERMAFLGENATGPVATSWGAVRIGLYARHLERWLRHFPIAQFHFVHGERLVEDPAAEVALVEDFLGVRRFVDDGHFYFNATKGFPCLRKLCGSGAGAPPRCLGKTKGRVHPAVDERVLQRLRHFYRPFNEKFYRLTGIDFGWS